MPRWADAGVAMAVAAAIRSAALTYLMDTVRFTISLAQNVKVPENNSVSHSFTGNTKHQAARIRKAIPLTGDIQPPQRNIIKPEGVSGASKRRCPSGILSLSIDDLARRRSTASDQSAKEKPPLSG